MRQTFDYSTNYETKYGFICMVSEFTCHPPLHEYNYTYTDSFSVPFLTQNAFDLSEFTILPMVNSLSLIQLNLQPWPALCFHLCPFSLVLSL